MPGIFDDPDLALDGQGAAPESGQDANSEAPPGQASEPSAGQGQAAEQTSVPATGDSAPDTDQPAHGQPADGGAQNLLAGKFRTPEELAKSYQELERERGRLGNELGQLRQALVQYQQAYQQALTYLQQLALQQQAAQQQAVQVQQAPPAPTQPSGQQVNGAVSQREEDIDPDKWLEQFYEKPLEAGEKLVHRVIQRELPVIQQEIERQLRDLLTPLAQQVQQTVEPVRAIAAKEQAREQIRSKLGAEEDALRAELAQKGINLDDYESDILQVYAENPSLVLYPGSLRTAFDLAVARRGTNQVPAPTEAQKRASRMPSSTGSRPSSAPTSPEDRIKSEIFGGQSRAVGVFD